MDAQVSELGSEFAGQRVCVAGLGVSGPPAAAELARLGARVTVVDGRDDEERRRLAADLERLGATVQLGERSAQGAALLAEIAPRGLDLVVTSPGWRPDAPLLAAAAAAGIPVMGDVEFAWRLRPALPGGGRQEWLAVTGTNGKTTTVRMLACMLTAAGYRAIAVGNVGTSVVDAVTAARPCPVLAVELSSFQLHWSSTVVPFAAVVLNVAGHHLDWHGDIESYAADKGRIYAPGTIAVCNADDARTRQLATAATGLARVVAFRRDAPGSGELGVAGGFLVDRAFGDGVSGDGASGDGVGDGVRLAAVSDVRPAAPHNVADALAAAALARAYGAAPGAIRAGLRAFQPEPHRISLVGQVRGVDYVDDSKATNPHAAAASLAAYPSVVWIAGGLFKGADSDVEALVDAAAPRLRGVVLLGVDRAKIRDALARHAPDVPVVEAKGTDTGVMDRVVAEAARLAVPGDTVLLAPAAQSFDIFRDYPARGDAFAAAVRSMADTQ
ncbi:MAG: UDP-N-acetylmuramoylalanine--D-glutamate ligase [Streptosporangiaceae bacterium]|jgi:UDP-N-acetylmuramoylalanine--D-glutamate ligase|nr:UDP-N-acetylmuramoylalanine--D-glutamate ligase [Streptosporangiaceae bacterium]